MLISILFISIFLCHYEFINSIYYHIELYIVQFIFSTEAPTFFFYELYYTIMEVVYAFHELEVQ